MQVLLLLERKEDMKGNKEYWYNYEKNGHWLCHKTTIADSELAEFIKSKNMVQIRENCWANADRTKILKIAA